MSFLPRLSSQLLPTHLLNEAYPRLLPRASDYLHIILVQGTKLGLRIGDQENLEENKVRSIQVLYGPSSLVWNGEGINNFPLTNLG